MSAQEVIASKLKILSEYYRQLKFYDKISLEEYKDDWKIQRIVERTLHLAIECCLDAANHIISNEGFREPADNKDIFAVLGEEKIVNKNLSANLGKMAQFRKIGGNPRYFNAEMKADNLNIRADRKFINRYRNYIISISKQVARKSKIYRGSKKR